MHISTSKDVPLGTKQMFLRINLTNSLQNKCVELKRDTLYIQSLIDASLVIIPELVLMSLYSDKVYNISNNYCCGSIIRNSILLVIYTY